MDIVKIFIYLSSTYDNNCNVVENELLLFANNIELSEMKENLPYLHS